MKKYNILYNQLSQKAALQPKTPVYSPTFTVTLGARKEWHLARISKFPFPLVVAITKEILEQVIGQGKATVGA